MASWVDPPAREDGDEAAFEEAYSRDEAALAAEAREEADWAEEDE